MALGTGDDAAADEGAPPVRSEVRAAEQDSQKQSWQLYRDWICMLASPDLIF